MRHQKQILFSFALAAVIVAHQGSSSSLRGEISAPSWLENIVQFTQKLLPGEPAVNVDPDSSKKTKMTPEEFRTWAEQMDRWRTGSPASIPLGIGASGSVDVQIVAPRPGEPAGGRDLPAGVSDRIPERSCFVCQYQEFTDCNASGLTATTCSRQPSGECTWHNGACKSRMKPECETLIAEAREEWKEIQAVENASVAAVFAEGCRRDSRVHYSGHSGAGRCSALFDQIHACIDMASLSESEQEIVIRVTNNGCSTFNNREEAEAYASDVAARLASQDLTNVRVVARAHQVPSSESCSSDMVIEITHEGTTTTYGSCHYASAPNERLCHEQNAVIRCTANGTTEREICCPSDRFYTNRSQIMEWQSGTRCRPVACHAPNTDCSYEDTRIWCAEAEGGIQRETCCKGRFGTTKWERGDRCPVLQCTNLLNQWCVAGLTMTCDQGRPAPQPISCCVLDDTERPHLGQWVEGSSCRCFSNAPVSRACTNLGRVLDCKDAGGNAAKEICCRTTMTQTQWSPGERCAAPRQQSGTCRGDGDRYYKTDALADMNTSFDRCFERERVRCRDAGWRFRLVNCFEDEHDGGVLGNWIVNKICSWTCAP